ncbi:MAG: hypothetical protein IBX50_09510 [Marinospirillum sp.]|uniref:hypothetical protein n=1 Tax=Marinospirillum sp. TaxID=2183934 RepID=UPI0019FAE353|nr:hypothetical protein [Marinospirillum sp.]MBE0506938.1 hypothetical protein [Marinospirillum sp.]
MSRSVNTLAILASLLVANCLYAQETSSREFTYLQVGIAVMNFDEDIQLDLRNSTVVYEGLSGINLSASWQPNDQAFIFLDTYSVNNSGYNTELSFFDMYLGAGFLFPLSQDASTQFVGKGFIVGRTYEACIYGFCAEIDDDGFGIEAGIRHSFSPVAAVDVAWQHLALDESGSVFRIGLHLGGKGHGFYGDFKLYDDASMTTLAYRYTF